MSFVRRVEQRLVAQPGQASGQTALAMKDRQGARQALFDRARQVRARLGRAGLALRRRISGGWRGFHGQAERARAWDDLIGFRA